MYFDELDINDDILDGLDAMNFVECTPVQEKAIPAAVEGRDLLASAQTGTGKTAAYLLPILELLSRGGYKENKVNALILVPTRELAQQVDMLLSGFSYYLNISWIAIYGGNDGVAFSQQQKALCTGSDIAIATPGRLLSILRTCDIDMSGVGFLVLDEADRMLDIGFYDDIMEILSHLPKERQTMMFSATFPTEVEKLSQKILRNPEKIKIAVSRPADGIDQGVYLLHESQKQPLLLNLFADPKRHGKSIVFLSSKQKVKELYHALRRLGVHAAQMHSDLEQAERSNVMLDFKNNKFDVLIATDIVARGIDIDDINTVINYDVPHQAEDYVHRVGRTARAGANGEAITLVTPRDKQRFDNIERFLKTKVRRLTLPEKVAAMEKPVDEKTTANRERRQGKGNPKRYGNKNRRKPAGKRNGNAPQNGVA